MSVAQNELLESILEWQNKSGLEQWTDDNLRNQIGIVITEDFAVISEDQEVEVEFTGRSKTKKQFGDYVITRDEGLHTISKQKPKKKTEENQD